MIRMCSGLALSFWCAQCLAAQTVVYFSVHDYQKRNLVVESGSEQLALRSKGSEVKSLPLKAVAPNFSVCLKEDQFNRQNVIVMDENGTILANIYLSRSHPDAPPSLRLGDNQGGFSKLYRACMGGGNRFVLALGSTANEISVDAARHQQAPGSLEQYITVSSGNPKTSSN